MFRGKLPVIRITLLYALFAGLWIVLSDPLAGWLFPSAAALVQVSILKGLGFVLVTAVALYAITMREFRREAKAVRGMRASEEKFRALFEQTGDANFILDGERYIDCNLAAVRLMGSADASQLIGRSPLELSPEFQPGGLPSAGKGREYLARALAGESQHFEWVHLTLAGQPLLVDVTLTAVDTGDRRLLFAVYHDLTDRQRAEEALRASREQYRLLFQHTPAGIIHYNLKGEITECNERLLEILRIERKDLITSDFSRLRDRSLLPAIFASIEGRSGQYEGPYSTTTSNAELWVSLRTAPVYDRDGQITGGVAILEDLTERRKAEIEAQASYELTLEGWARALELRDRETEGHSRRVTELCMRLAREMGLSEAELVNVRRGALIHDIGKLGVPDTILLKPTELTAEEKQIMAQHPLYAARMLGGIPYLQGAMAIPYSHHERWDGTGYPLGLKGEEIPLSARIFAVVDVWDALLHDRPYRPAWPRFAVRQYLIDEKGSHFDPSVVDAFLRVIEGEG